MRSFQEAINEVIIYKKKLGLWFSNSTIKEKEKSKSGKETTANSQFLRIHLYTPNS